MLNMFGPCVLIVLTIIDRSFCRRRKKNACSPEHRSQSSPRDRYIGIYHCTVVARTRSEIGSEGNSARYCRTPNWQWIPFLCAFFRLFSIHTCV